MPFLALVVALKPGRGQHLQAAAPICAVAKGFAAELQQLLRSLRVFCAEAAVAPVLEMTTTTTMARLEQLSSTSAEAAQLAEAREHERQVLEELQATEKKKEEVEKLPMQEEVLQSQLLEEREKSCRRLGAMHKCSARAKTHRASVGVVVCLLRKRPSQGSETNPQPSLPCHGRLRRQT